MLEFSPDNIQLHREEKLKSLLLGSLEQEKVLFDSLLDNFKFSTSKIKLIEKAYKFACSQNYGDHILLKFYAGHPVRVSIFVMNWMIRTKERDSNYIIASLLHNAIEKKILSTQEIEEDYGTEVLKSISVLTVDRDAEQNKGWAQNYYDSIYSCGKMTKILKAFDKFDNAYAIILNPSLSVRIKYLNEIENYIIPIFEEFDPELVDYFKNLLLTSKSLEHVSAIDWLQERK